MTEKASKDHSFVKNLTNLLSQQSTSISPSNKTATTSQVAGSKISKGSTSTAAMLLLSPSNSQTPNDDDDATSVSTINTSIPRR